MDKIIKLKTVRIMKIKSIILTGIVAIILFPVQSCLNLDETVYDKITGDNFGNTEAEVTAIIGPAYGTLKRYFHAHWLYLSECTGDMAITPTRKGGDWFDGGQFRDLHMHTWTPQTATIRNGWNAASQSISACNLIYETVSGKDLEENDKKQALAEIRGIRAFWLYVMMDAWGNVPLAVDFKDTGLPETKSRQEVFNYILKELNEIKDIVRSDVSSASYGKFTRGAAYTLLAKMYLNANAWGVTSGVSDNWSAAINACDTVMKLGYILEPTWKNNFQVQNQNSGEAIFAVCYSANDTENENTLHLRTLHYKDNIALGGKWSAWNGICAQTDYAKLFDEADTRLDGSFLRGEMVDPTVDTVIVTAHNRKLNHYIDVIQIPGSQYAGSTWGQVNQEDGYRCYKWPFDRATLGAMENDFHIFRLADVYLMKAEALVRAGKDNATATALVNAIRERGYGNADHNYASVTLGNIALERKLELAWECHSRQDCIRFGTFQNARYLKTSTAGKDYLNIFPIPQTALDANKNLKQNPEYK